MDVKLTMMAAAALAGVLLDRHGVLTRAAARGEGVAGGFAAVYPVLRAMEESGRIRRGYFVTGLGGAQFALPGAVDRLRAFRDGVPEGFPGAVVLAATDPANPYGVALAWPETEGARPQRAAGAFVSDGVKVMRVCTPCEMASCRTVRRSVVKFRIDAFILFDW